MKFLIVFEESRIWFPSLEERDGRVRPDADKDIADEILKVI
jgi:hypothetical protein